MRLAVDVMGGDHAPDAILKGCVDAIAHLDDGDELILVGDEAVIAETLRERGVGDPRLVIHHAADVIAMHESPARAVRAKTESSIVKMALLGSRKAEQPVDAVLSAGNTGACVSAAIMHLKRLPGVHRPGIAVTIPAFHGPLVLCDAGANPEPKAAHLWQYGVMAEVYAKHALGIASPRVALMNIGAEEGKGSDLVRGTAELLKATPGLNYIGYIEGRDFFDGAADVVVTDGFVGNTVLKMAEGLAKSLFTAIAHEIFTHDPQLAVQFEPVVKGIYAKNDYHEYGGAPLLGVNGNCIIAHGSSEARTISAAVRNTKAHVAAGTNEHIMRRIADVAHLEQPAAQGSPGSPPQGQQRRPATPVRILVDRMGRSAPRALGRTPVSGRSDRPRDIPSTAPPHRGPIPGRESRRFAVAGLTNGSGGLASPRRFGPGLTARRAVRGLIPRAPGLFEKSELG